MKLAGRSGSWSSWFRAIKVREKTWESDVNAKSELSTIGNNIGRKSIYGRKPTAATINNLRPGSKARTEMIFFSDQSPPGGGEARQEKRRLYCCIQQPKGTAEVPE